MPAPPFEPVKPENWGAYAFAPGEFFDPRYLFGVDVNEFWFYYVEDKMVAELGGHVLELDYPTEYIILTHALREARR